MFLFHLLCSIIYPNIEAWICDLLYLFTHLMFYFLWFALLISHFSVSLSLFLSSSSSFPICLSYSVSRDCHIRNLLNEARFATSRITEFCVRKNKFFQLQFLILCRVVLCVRSCIYIFYSASLFIVILSDFFRDCFFFPQSIDRTSMLYAACNYVYADWFCCPIDLFIE